jgi:hypothetical protein
MIFARRTFKESMMNEKTNREPAAAASDTPGTLVSRRGLLGGLLAAAVVPAALSRTWARSAPAAMRSERSELVPALSVGEVCSPTPRYLHSAICLTDGRLLVAGGWRHSGLPSSVPPLGEAQVYDPAANTWSRAASLKTPRAQHAAVLLADGRVLVVGGLNHAPLAEAEIYDPRADTWTKVAPMEEARYGHAASVANGLVIVTGGFRHGPLASVQIYDVAADTWRLAR